MMYFIFVLFAFAIAEVHLMFGMLFSCLETFVHDDDDDG